MRFLNTASLIMAFAALVGCQSNKENPSEPASPATPVSAVPSVKVRLKTNMGNIVLQLDREKAPATVDNFRKYVENKQYDGTVFHRVISDFMIQGGGFALSNNQLIEKPTAFPPVRNEGQNGLRNVRGSIAMARTADPNSARAQFFINVVNNPMLDYPNNGGYAVFGKVVEGMDVVDKIKMVPTATSMINMIHPMSGQTMPSPAENVPTTTVMIESAEVLPAGS